MVSYVENFSCSLINQHLDTTVEPVINEGHLNQEATCFKLGLQYDASISIALRASGFLFQRCVASGSQCPTYQILEKIDVRNRI